MRWLTGTVECGKCELLYDGNWPEPSMDQSDMAEVPEAEQTCPGCGHTQDEVWPGWGWQSEAG